jgi:enamine deaminase RidA (YjgF/YER057c/UK114 family)
MLHVSGQVGQSPEGDLPPDFRGQCRQALLNVSAVLNAADMTLADIVKMSFYLVRREDMDTLVEVRKELLDGCPPGDHHAVRRRSRGAGLARGGRRRRLCGVKARLPRGGQVFVLSLLRDGQLCSSGSKPIITPA